MLTLQSIKSQNVCLLTLEVKRDSLGDVILLSSLGVSFTEVQEGLVVSYFTLGATLLTHTHLLLFQSSLVLIEFHIT